MMPWWARAGDGRIICFGNFVSLFAPQRRHFLSCVSHMQSKQTLTETGKWESDNANEPEWVWLLHIQDNIIMFHVEKLSHAKKVVIKFILTLLFTICLYFTFMCSTDDRFQFITMAVTLFTQYYLQTYKLYVTSHIVMGPKLDIWKAEQIGKIFHVWGLVHRLFMPRSLCGLISHQLNR